MNESEAKVVLDASRQWGETLDEIQAGHRRRYEFAARKVAGTVLDAACGCGYGTRMLHETGCEVTGVDFFPLAIEWARTFYGGPEYFCSRITDEPWRGRFDWVVCLETLEHLEAPTEALEIFARSADNLIASSPNEEQYPFVAERFARDQSPHFRHYTPAEFDMLLASSGWRVRERHCQRSKVAEVVPGTDGLFLIYVCERSA